MQWLRKFYGCVHLNHRVFLHAIDATPARWRGIKTLQRGGRAVVVYFRKEGRALGEVTKYLVYNMRKRQEGGDKAKSTSAVSYLTPSTRLIRVSAGISTALKVLLVFRIRVFKL